MYLARVVSLAGDWISIVAVARLVTELTGRPGAAAFFYAATVLPVFVASPIAGMVADRFERRRTLVIAELARVPVARTLCLAAYFHSTGLAGAAVIVLASGASCSDPIASAATPNLVAPEDLATAQALMGAVWGSMLMVGAGIGGVVAEVFGRQTAFAVDALSFVASAWLIGGSRAPMQRGEVETTGSIREAITFIRATPVVMRLIFAKVGVSAANGIVGLLPAFALRRFAQGPMAPGGCAASALWNARYARFAPPESPIDSPRTSLPLWWTFGAMK